MAILLVALIATDPGAITKTSKTLRTLSISLVALMVLAALSSTAVLIRDLVEGCARDLDRGTALGIGASIWVINVVAFALLYWQFDCGGAPLGPAGCRRTPTSRSRNNSIPSSRRRTGGRSAMPLAPWAKLAMALEAVISLAVLGLVVARAVNVLT